MHLEMEGVMVEAILVDSVPKLVSKARLKYDKVRAKHLLLLPEKVVVLNETAASILSLCDGNRTLHMIAEKLRVLLQANTEGQSRGELPELTVMEADISEFIGEMADEGWVVIH
jgi:pyrroloquinoline quinone biosynthesis protein D